MTVAVFLRSRLGAMALGVPIACSLLRCGVASMAHLGNFDAQILAQNLMEGANSFPLLAVPFLMLAGEIMNVGGLSKRIVNLALTLLGHLRDDPLKHQLEHLGAAVRGEAEPLLSARDGLTNLRVPEAIVAAAKSGSTVEIKAH